MPEAARTEVARTEYETMVYERKERTGYIMFNRPQVLNAVNDQFEQDLHDALLERVRYRR